ncbi:hypothetical protein BKA70DRAFT_648044 [Coprinopsis sp. MPI-PUGE-AT-0042]|nr:hypothetical protein BKA70DRAFT_648044 [Coprinopsis sp. MPI-PUGE-AT-0042]
MLPLFVVSALVAYVSAQSENCRNTITSVGVNPDAAACLNTPALIPILTGDSSQSLIPTINNWLTGLCGAPACSDATLTAVVTNLTTGCADETGAFGLTGENVESSINLIKQYYPTARKIFCLKDGSDNCITKTLQAVESKVGTLSLDGLTEKIANGSFSEITSDVYCTDCTKAAWNVIVEDVPAVANNTELKNQAEQTCGADFANGEKPANVVSSESAEGAQDDGSAASLSNGLYLGVAGSSLAAFLSLL